MTVLVPPVYCSQCARVGTYAGESLLPGRPLVTCQYVGSDDAIHGHGRLPGFWDRAEAQALVDEKRERTRRANHQAGRHLARAVPECPDCQAALMHQGHLKRRYIDPDCVACRHLPEPSAWLPPTDADPSPRSRRGR